MHSKEGEKEKGAVETGESRQRETERRRRGKSEGERGEGNTMLNREHNNVCSRYQGSTDQPQESPIPKHS